MKDKKTLLIIIGFCIAIGVVYAVYNMLPQNQAKWVLIDIAIVIVIIWLIVKMVRMVRLSKVVAGPTNLLYEEKNPKAYTEEMEKILENVSQREQKDLIRINISTGLLYNGDYEEALTLLDKIAINGQPVVNQVLCFANQALASYLDGKIEQGNVIVKEQRELFKKYEKASGISNNLVVVYTAEKLAAGDYEQAWNQLQKLNGVKVSSVLQDIVDYFCLQATKGLKKEEEYSEYKKKLTERKIVPAIANKMNIK